LLRDLADQPLRRVDAFGSTGVDVVRDERLRAAAFVGVYNTVGGRACERAVPCFSVSLFFCFVGRFCWGLPGFLPGLRS